MKKIPYLTLIASLFFLTAKAQVAITLFSPNPFEVRISDMFNAGIINSSGSTIKLYLTVSVKESGSGKILVNGKTPEKEFAVGYSQVSEGLLLPVYEFYDQLLARSRLFSFGNYQLCMQVHSTVTQESVAEECLSFEVTSLSPPILLNPENEAEINTAYPLLVWLPPTPSNPALGITYDLKLVELYPNQTPYDAIVRNPAVIEPKNISLTNVQYPTNAVALKDDVKYAWKVIARTPNGKVIGETEVWSFIKKPSEIKEKILAPVKNYIELKSVKDASYTVVQDEMKIVYQEKYGKSLAELRITSSDGKIVYTENLTFVQGENRHVINLRQIGVLKHDAFYTLEVIAPDRQTQYLMFKNLK